MSEVAVAPATSEAQKTILISDTETLAQQLATLLPDASEMDTHAFSDGAPSAETIKSNLVLVDCSGAEWADALKLLEELQSAAEDTTVALLNIAEDQDLQDALKWPVLSGVFTEDMGEELLEKGLSELLEGRYWFSRSQMNEMASFRKAPRSASKLAEALSPRELEVLDLTSQGKSNADIAKTLFLSQHTVKTHLYNLYKKIGVVNRTQAVHWYQENN